MDESGAAVTDALHREQRTSSRRRNLVTSAGQLRPWVMGTVTHCTLPWLRTRCYAAPEALERDAVPTPID